MFSSILVPYTALTIGEEIGQGACEGVRSHACSPPMGVMRASFVSSENIILW